MRFLIHGRTIGVQITGIITGDDLDELGWTQGDAICVAREQTLDAARSVLSSCFVYLSLNGPTSKRVSSAAATQFIAAGLADGTLATPALADLLEQFQTQYQSQGGDAELAESMGLPAKIGAAMPLIEWKSLTGDDLRRQVIRWHHCGHLNDELFAVYIAKVESLKLDPLAGECVPRVVVDPDTKRATVHVIVTLIAMTRIALRTGQFKCFTSPEWIDEDGASHSVWINAEKKPTAAVVGVIRHDYREPVNGVAEWASYAVYRRVGKDTFVLAKFWERYPTGQLLKCAKANALRSAFPEVAGLYIFDEVEWPAQPRQRQAQKQQGGDEVESSVAVIESPRGQMADLFRHMRECGAPGDAACHAIIDQIRATHGTDLEDDHFEHFATKVMEETHRRYGRRRR